VEGEQNLWKERVNRRKKKGKKITKRRGLEERDYKGTTAAVI